MADKQTPHERPIIRAILEAKKKFAPLIKDKNNPFFKSKYADLAALMDVVEEPLLEQGVVILQPTMRWEQTGRQYVKTRLVHVSGDEEAGTLDIPEGLDPQKTVAAITYLKRCSLQAILGIAARDDDGETAVGRGEAHQEQPKPKPQLPKPAMVAEKKPDGTKEYKVDPNFANAANAPKPTQARAKDVKDDSGTWTGRVADVKTAEKIGWYEIVGAKGDKFYSDKEPVSDAAKLANLNKDMVQVEWKKSALGNMIVQKLVVAEFKKD